MTICKYLIICINIVGLASIERTPQEETFMQLLNAALSNLVLFKSQFAVSRDISSMFQRFQDGTNYFGDDPDIFQVSIQNFPSRQYYLPAQSFSFRLDFVLLLKMWLKLIEKTLLLNFNLNSPKL